MDNIAFFLDDHQTGFGKQTGQLFFNAVIILVTQQVHEGFLCRCMADQDADGWVACEKMGVEIPAEADFVRPGWDEAVLRTAGACPFNGCDDVFGGIGKGERPARL